MRRVAIAAGVGVVAGLLVAGIYFGAPLAGFRIDVSVLVALAAILAFASSVAAFTLSALARPIGGRAHASTRMTESPVWQFVTPFKEPGAIALVVRPGIPVEHLLMRYQGIFDKPAENAERKFLISIKKAKKGFEPFNPVVLKALFEKLKPFTKSEHVLLLNEHDEFMGYIPWANAIKEFTGDNAETKIGKNIVEVLDDPAKSIRLRAVGGMATQDSISDTASIHDAAKKTWYDDPMHGLVVYHGDRNRKLVGVIARNSVLQLVSTGA